MLNAQVEPIYTKTSGSYTSERRDNIKLLKSLLSLHGIESVEYSVTNNWIRIKGIIINGISREDVEECYKKLKKKGSSKTDE